MQPQDIGRTSGTGRTGGTGGTGSSTRLGGIRLEYLVVAAAALAPLLLRGVLVVEKLGLPGIGDVGGVLSDLAVSAAFAALLIALSRGSRIATALGLAVWGLLHYANYENVQALDSLASADDVRFLTDETFLRGSALWISSPVLLGGLVGGGAVLGWLLAPARGVRRTAVGGVALVAASLLGIHALWMLHRLPVGWRYADFIQVNVENGLEALAGGPDTRSASDAMTQRLPELLANLDGTPLTSVGHRRQNVLLVFIESLSGAFLPDNVEAQGAEAGPLMPRLQEIARGGLSYDTFIAHQRRTNRGLYAGLCGELPNLLRGLPKMTSYIDSSDPRRCLPRVLSEEGYKTVYLQAAPLAFMLKDQFMPKAGFEEVHGHDWFKQAYVRSVWGVDDRAFFEQSLQMIDRLQQGDRPWFLTLLTVGTHHPAIIPNNFEKEKPIRFSRALSYTDQALAAFVKALEERGVRKDTLILITSDESRGVSADRDETTASLSQNWGLLVALLPDHMQEQVHEPFGLMDLPISILDYLGLTEDGGHFFGRSVFRRYATPRYMFFGNRNLQIVGALTPDRKLVLCPAEMEGCRLYAPEQGRLFAPGRTELPWSDDTGGVVRDIARLSVELHGTGLQPEVYELVQTPTFEVRRRHFTLIQGGQQIELKKDQWIDVDFEFDATGGVHDVEFEHYLSMAGQKPEHFFMSVPPGRTMRFRYTFRATHDVRSVSCRSLARLTGQEPAQLTFRRARMTVRTVGARPEPGVVVQRHEVVRTSTLGPDEDGPA